jgi:hypothetical protein
LKPPITLSDLKKTACWPLNGHLEEVPGKKEKKLSKYGNNTCEVDGIKFDSEKEAKRYGELKILRKAGVIGLLELQKSYELNPGGTHSLKYIADFVYRIIETGELVVEDCKGMETVVFKKKEKLMKKVHEIIIKKS